MTAAWGALHVGLRTPTGLVYSVHAPGAGFESTPLARGLVERPAFRGDGVSAQDERRLTRGAGRRAVRWSGLWYVPEPGSHEIFVAGNGEIVVRLDGERVVRHSGRTDDPASGSVHLDEGFHHLVVRFVRSDERPWLTVHWAPPGEVPRPFDPETLLPPRADEERYVWNRWTARLRGASVAAWILAATMVLGPWVSGAFARVSAIARAARAGSDLVTTVGLVGSGLFVTTTLLQHELARLLGGRPTSWFNLLGEGNLAAWWSGVLLLLGALYAADLATGRGSEASRRPADTGSSAPSDGAPARLGWTCVAAVLAALSADEIGVLHEHMGELVGWGTWWSLLPFALALGALLVLGLRALWRVPGLRGTVLALAAGFAVLGTVPPLLEIVEHAYDWGIAGAWHHPYNLRATIEEASELFGILLLLHACAGGRGAAPERRSPVRFAGPRALALRRPLLVVGGPLAVVVAFLSPGLPEAMMPGAWWITALFTVVAARSLFHRPEVPGGRLLGGIALVGSAAGTAAPAWPPIWLAVSVLLAGAWAHARLRRSRCPGWWLPVLSLALGLLPFVADLPAEGAWAAIVPALLALTALALTPGTER